MNVPELSHLGTDIKYLVDAFCSVSKQMAEKKHLTGIIEFEFRVRVIGRKKDSLFPPEEILISKNAEKEF